MRLLLHFGRNGGEEENESEHVLLNQVTVVDTKVVSKLIGHC